MKKILLSLTACLAAGVSANAELVTDVLTPTSLELDGKSAYADYTYTGTSGAEYALQCSNGTDIQLRSTNNSGIVVTKSVGTVTKVEVVWNSSTSATGNRTLNVYGSETAYTAPSDLYATTANKLGGITCGTNTEYTLSTPAAYLGLRSDNGAMYLTSISITWDTDGSTGGDTTEPDQPDPDQPDTEAGEYTIVWADQGYANAYALETFTKDGITYSFAKGSNNNVPAYYSSGTAIRLYGGNSMTLSVAKGYLITKVEFTVGSSNKFNSASTANVGTFNVDDAVWTSTDGAQTVTFTQGGASGHVRIEQMVITVIAGKGGETPEQPEQPEQPTETITVAEALAILAGGQTNVKATVKGIISQIDEVSPSFGNATYFIKDALTDANALEVYRGKWMNGEGFTSEDQIAVGGTIVVSGTLVNYNGTYEFTTGSTVISYEAPTGDVPTPPTPEVPTGSNVTFDFTTPATYITDFSADAAEYDVTGMTFTESPISVSFEAAESATNKPRFFKASSGTWDLRFYKDNTITISAGEGYLISGIEFTGTNLANQSITWSNGSFANNIWSPAEGNAISSLELGKNATGNNPTIKTMKVYYVEDETQGVAGIETEGGEAVYFNLQGVRVMNPDRGLYIKVEGNKASKVIL